MLRTGRAGRRGRRAAMSGRTLSGRTLAPFAACAALFVALALFGARFHWVEEVGSAERDGYVSQAEQILAGELPRDPYRPAFYPLLVAGLARLLGDPFVAARTLSNLAAAALALIAFFIARRLSGVRAAGWWAFALVAVNPNLWTIGQHATTDMTFAALAAAALLAGLVYLEAPGWRPALAAGAALGLAAFTRGNALFLVPGLLLAWWLAPGRPAAAGEPRRRFADLFAASGVCLALLAPHFVLRAAAFGDPFHDENWKNLAWKLDGHPDWSALGRVAHEGPAELLVAEAGAIVAGAVAELARFALSGAAQLLGTPLHVAAFVVGAAAALAWRRRPGAWLLVAAGGLLVGVAIVFFTWGRLLLALLPVAVALTVTPWGGDVGHRFGRWLEAWLARAGLPTSRRTLLAAGIVAGGLLVTLLAVKTFVYRLPAFVERHPYLEVAVARQWAAATSPDTVLAGTSPFLGRYLERRWVDLPDAHGAELTEPGRYLERLHDLVAAEGVDLLIVGRLDLRDRPAALVGTTPPAPWLEPVGGDERVRVWRVVGP